MTTPASPDAAARTDSPISILRGADEIGAYLFPNDPPQRRRRRVYHLTSEVPEADRLPTFKLGATICARPETLLRWISRREGMAALDADHGER